VQAVRKGPRVTSVPGSMSATSGTTALLMMAIFTWAATSLMMANWDTSAEEPAVVGTQMRGGMGVRTSSTPS